MSIELLSLVPNGFLICLISVHMNGRSKPSSTVIKEVHIQFNDILALSRAR